MRRFSLFTRDINADTIPREGAQANLLETLATLGTGFVPFVTKRVTKRGGPVLPDTNHLLPAGGADISQLREAELAHVCLQLVDRLLRGSMALAFNLIVVTRHSSKNKVHGHVLDHGAPKATQLEQVLRATLSSGLVVADDEHRQGGATKRLDQIVAIPSFKSLDGTVREAQSAVRALIILNMQNKDTQHVRNMEITLSLRKTKNRTRVMVLIASE